MSLIMSFGYLLFFFCVFCPFICVLLIVWAVSGEIMVGKFIGFIFLGIFGLILLLGTISWMGSIKELDKADYYGEYIINRDYFEGPQTDWQYNNFRFEITEKDSIFFYVTDRKKVLKTYKGKVHTVTPYESARLAIKMDEPSHHILSGNPTTYRSAWRFYLVFHSPKFNNVFFKKGKWKAID